jgi:phage N-6-adenine-methyltransferase
MPWTAGKDERQDWATPAWLFEELDAEFVFTLDPCASSGNAKCERYFTVADDGLAQDWGDETVFMNPPYGRGIADWMRKARSAADAGATVVCLVPARVDSIWWNETTHRSECRFRFGRVNFVGGHAAFPGPIAIVVMRPDDPERAAPARGSWRTIPR